MPSRRKKNKLRRLGSKEQHAQSCQYENSLEEDLRRQRLRQQQRKAMEEEESKRPEDLETNLSQQSVPLNEDDMRREIESRIPSRPMHMMLKGGLPSADECNGISSLLLQSSHEQSPVLTPSHRCRIRRLWHSRLLLENMHIHPRASTLYSRKLKWLDHTLPDGTHTSWDMTCKHHLHSSARTLDVALYEGDSLPTIATTIQGGWALFRPPRGREDRVHTLRGNPIHTIRMHEKSSKCGTIVRRKNSNTPYKFQLYPLPDVSSYMEADLHAPVNDFCFGTDLALFAGPRFKGGSPLSPLFLPLDRPNGDVRILNVRDFPQSDALRVEVACEHEKYVAFAHRNGQVSLLDLRQSQICCGILKHGPEMGSATDLAFLSSSSSTNHLLVKRSFGSTQMHDLRKLSKSSASVVYDLKVPSSQLHKTLSANCNGLAVDPMTKQNLVAPYLNQQHEPCLGIWSLGTGIMVGHKVLTKNPEHDVIFTEVCQRATSGYAVRGEASSSFGVWFKCGRFSKSKIDSRAGSLHHVSFPGKWE